MRRMGRTRALFPPETGRSRTVRMVLLALVTAAVLAGFWRNSERRLTHIAEQGVVNDATGQILPETRNELTRLASRIRQVSGLALLVHVHAAPPPMLEAGAGVARLDISPATGEAVLTLPGLWARAVGRARLQEVEDMVMAAMENDGWQASLPAATERLLYYLQEAAK